MKFSGFFHKKTIIFEGAKPVLNRYNGGVKKGEIKVPEIPQDPDPCGNGRKPRLPKPPKKKPLDPRLERNKTKR